MFRAEERTYLMFYISRNGDLALLEIFLGAGHFLWSDKAAALQAAAEGGHLEVVERLLAAVADNAVAGGYGGQAALQGAAQGAHVEVVERLLAAAADCDAAAAGGGNGGRAGAPDAATRWPLGAGARVS